MLGPVGAFSGHCETSRRFVDSSTNHHLVPQERGARPGRGQPQPDSAGRPAQAGAGGAQAEREGAVHAAEDQAVHQDTRQEEGQSPGQSASPGRQQDTRSD